MNRAEDIVSIVFPIGSKQPMKPKDYREKVIALGENRYAACGSIGGAIIAGTLLLNDKGLLVRQ